MGTSTKLSIVRLAAHCTMYSTGDPRIANADLVIDDGGNVIKERYGNAGRGATVTERKHAQTIQPIEPAEEAKS